MLVLFLYVCFGLLLGARLLPEERPAIRVWLGLVFSCVLLCWLPCIFAFFLGFTAAAQYAALSVVLFGSLVLAAEAFIRKKTVLFQRDQSEQGRRAWVTQHGYHAPRCQ